MAGPPQVGNQPVPNQPQYYQQPQQYQPAPQYAPQYAPPQRSPPRTGLIVGIVVAVVVVLLIVLYAVFFGHIGVNHATVTVIVSSTHLLFGVNYALTDNGQSVSSGILNPGGSVRVTLTPSWGGSSCSSHTYVATSTGGGLGSQTDSETLNICDGGTYSSTLNI